MIMENPGVDRGLAVAGLLPGADAVAVRPGRGTQFRLVTQARKAGLDPEMELRAAARRYRELVRHWERS